jgi:hypothetical protein
MTVLSPASWTTINSQVALIQAAWEVLITMMEVQDIEGIDRAAAIISHACHHIRSEIAYNAGVQGMPKREGRPEKKPASLDDIFGAL